MNPLVRRLRHYTELSAAGEMSIVRLARTSARAVERNADLVVEGEHARHAHVILEGWAARYKTLRDGRQQISALFIAGDLFGLHSGLIRELDHSVRAITPVQVARISQDDVNRLMDRHPRMAKGLLWQQLVLNAVERTWLVNLGQRTAYERVAHLFCEMQLRLSLAGLAAEACCEFPLTQIELAQATGISAVHVNRVLQRLRAGRLIELDANRLKIRDLDRLRKAAMFDPSYLHLGAGPRY
jgi:CRP-like cAMP-binding protein